MRPSSLILAAAFCFAAVPATSGQPAITVAPDQPVANASQVEWSKAWWQWAGSFDAVDSPVADRTGRHCHLKQKGPVWFLAGTYGTARVVRTCTVPRDKYIFFPLVNYVVMPGSVEGCVASCCFSYAATARAITDDPSILVLEVDGRRVEGLSKYRQATKECFDMGALAEPSYRVFPSAANGYYVMLPPLSPGKHVLNFGGSLPGISQAVTYTLIVK
jgi:hypothetical protein